MTRRTSRDIILLQLVTQVINQLRRGGTVLQLQGEKPIFLQLAEQLEDGILSGAYPEGSQVPSITEYAATYKINPATALKGINLLVNAGLLYKKRGIGMFVAPGAREKLAQRRSERRQRFERFYHDYVEKLVHEAKGLGLTLEQLLDLVRRGFHDVN